MLPASAHHLDRVPSQPDNEAAPLKTQRVPYQIGRPDTRTSLRSGAQRTCGEPQSQSNETRPEVVPTACDSEAQSWDFKPATTEEPTAWNTPNIHAWAHNIDRDQAQSITPKLQDHAYDVSQTNRPGSTRPQPKLIRVNTPHDMGSRGTSLAGGAAISTDRGTELADHENGGQIPSLSAAPLTATDPRDHIDKLAASTDNAEDRDQPMRSRKEDDPNFWWEEPDPRDCPSFQSRRIIVT